MRLNFIDFAKGFGIVLVVLGHCTSSDLFFNRWIYSFHMPLFFFLSGYTFNKNKYKNWIDVAEKRIYQLLVPYIYFVLILIIGNSILESSNLESFLQVLGENFYNFIKTGSLYALWFLPILYLVEVLYNLISRLKIGLIGLVLLLLSFIGHLFFTFSLYLPFSLMTVFPAIGFYGAGNLTKGRVESFLQHIRDYRLCYIVLSLGVLSIFLLA